MRVTYKKDYKSLKGKMATVPKIDIGIKVENEEKKKKGFKISSCENALK